MILEAAQSFLKDVRKKLILSLVYRKILLPAQIFLCTDRRIEFLSPS